jgi:hypothetical protein
MLRHYPALELLLCCNSQAAGRGYEQASSGSSKAEEVCPSRPETSGRWCTSLSTLRGCNHISLHRAIDVLKTPAGFSVKAGRTPAEVFATLDRFVGGTQEGETELRARRQAVIDQMLQAALKVERRFVARRGVSSGLLASDCRSCSGPTTG